MISLLRISKPMILLSMMFLLFSCKKQDVETKELIISKELIAEVREIATTTGSNRIALAMLNPAEKFALVQEQLSYILENAELNSTQKALIGKIKTEMPKDLYGDIEVRKSYMAKLNSLKQDMLNVLGKEFIANYFAKIINVNKSTTASSRNRLSSDGGTVNSVGGVCKCSIKSDWCSDPNGVDYYCNGSNCEIPVDEGGCGTFFIYDCDGLCFLRINARSAVLQKSDE